MGANWDAPTDRIVSILHNGLELLVRASEVLHEVHDNGARGQGVVHQSNTLTDPIGGQLSCAGVAGFSEFVNCAAKAGR